jgi:penicillin V acylase-like amidase (Ntn superfamily)
MQNQYTPDQIKVIKLALPAMKRLTEAFDTCALYCDGLNEKGLALRANMIVEYATDFTTELEKKLELQDE